MRNGVRLQKIILRIVVLVTTFVLFFSPLFGYELSGTISILTWIALTVSAFCLALQ